MSEEPSRVPEWSVEHPDREREYWANLGRLAQAEATAQHPEDYCHKCGGPNVVWFAPNSLWNKSVREANQPEILCPVCFVRLAEAAGVQAVWEVAPQQHRESTQAALDAAQEVVNIAYRDRGQCPHRDTIAAIFTKRLAPSPTGET